ncbi:hypothetical protein B0G81_8600 [Paraburkholderia sp. BL6665CI2N2]|nr:hypothetical protein B0G81_8600 [Paraburkholderia sp. BL6665CI2N2]
MARKHGRCRRGVRPLVGSIGRPGVNQKQNLQRFWKAIAEGLPSEESAGRCQLGGGETAQCQRGRLLRRRSTDFG